MKKVVTVLLILSLLCVNLVYASSTTDKAIFELTSLGIIEGDENGEMHVNDYITRAEFTKIIVKMLGYDDLANTDDTVFYDVLPTHPMAGYIKLGYDLGYIVGDGSGYFNPEDNILMRDCVKILVEVLGYGPVAPQKGGYPSGYTTLATQLGVLNDVSVDLMRYARRGDVMVMVYNALYIKMFEPVTYGDEKEYSQSDETLMDRLMSKYDIHHISGVVTANSDVWLMGPISDIQSDQVEIDGTLFYCGNTNAADYIGKKVEAYYKEDNSGTYTLLNVAPAVCNEELTIEYRQYASSTSNEIKYRDEAGKIRRIALDKNVMYVYNNRVLTDYASGDNVIENGKYVCIDNNRDGKYDYVFMYEYECGVVERVNSSGCIFLKSALKVSGQSYILTDDDDSDVTYHLTDANRTEISIDDVAADDVVTVFKSKDGSYIEVVVSKNVITGRLEEVEGCDAVSIEGTRYEQRNGLNISSIKVGSYVKAYINQFNELVYMIEDNTKGGTYGYIMKIAKKGIDNYQVLMLVSDNVLQQVETETDEETENETEIPVLVCRNKKVLIFDVNNKVTFNNEKIDASSIASKLKKYVPVCYKLNAENKIQTIEQLSQDYGSTVTKIDYNAKDKTFGGISGVTPFGVDENTQVICIPTNDDASDEDMMTQIRIDNRDASIKYLASGYDFDDDSQNVKLLVVAQEMKADTILNLTRTSDLGVVVKQGGILDKDGEFVTATTIMCEGKINQYISKDLSAENGDADNLSKGDFVVFETNNDGYLVNAKIIKSLAKKCTYGQSNVDRVNDSITGVVKNVQLNRINNYRNKRVHILELEVDGISYNVELAARNIPNIYIYDRNAEKENVTVGGIDDIMYGDVVCIARPMGYVKDCVIVRGGK